MMFKSIKSKIVVFAVMATLVPSLGLGLLSFRQNEAQINDNVTRELRALTNYAIREIELWVEKRVHETQVTSASIVVIEGLTTVADRRTQAARIGLPWLAICVQYKKNSTQYWN